MAGKWKNASSVGANTIIEAWIVSLGNNTFKEVRSIARRDALLRNSPGATYTTVEIDGFEAHKPNAKLQGEDAAGQMRAGKWSGLYRIETVTPEFEVTWFEIKDEDTGETVWVSA